MLADARMPDKHPAVTDRRRLDRAADLLLALPEYAKAAHCLRSAPPPQDRIKGVARRRLGRADLGICQRSQSAPLNVSLRSVVFAAGLIGAGPNLARWIGGIVFVILFLTIDEW